MIDRLLQLYAHAPEHPAKQRIFRWLSQGLLRGRPLCLTVAGGLRMRLRPGDHIESCLIFNDWHERITTRFMLANLAPGDLAFVAGAHIGYFVMQAARAVGTKGRVITCEPSPENMVTMLDHLAANRLGERVTAICAALGETPCFLPLERPPSHSSGMASLLDAEPGTPYQARVVTIEWLLRELAAPCPDLVQLDIESFEWAAVRGLGALRPRLIILESDPRHYASQGQSQTAFFEFLRGMNYALFTVTGESVDGPGYFPENNIVAARIDLPPPRWPEETATPP